MILRFHVISSKMRENVLTLKNFQKIIFLVIFWLQKFLKVKFPWFCSILLSNISKLAKNHLRWVLWCIRNENISLQMSPEATINKKYGILQPEDRFESIDKKHRVFCQWNLRFGPIFARKWPFFAKKIPPKCKEMLHDAYKSYSGYPETCWDKLEYMKRRLQW